MRRPQLQTGFTVRLFVVYALLSAVPVVALGLILAATFRSEARQRGLLQGREEASLLADTAIDPLLDGRPLSEGIDPAERPGFNLLSARAGDPHLLRLRVRGLNGKVMYSLDGSTAHIPVDPDALRAAKGQTVVSLTRLDADVASADDITGNEGPMAIEAYVPLLGGTPPHRVGVLEVYLPYAPIQRDVSRLLTTLQRDLSLGLGGLYLILFLITASVSGRLRRESGRNAFLADHDPLTELPNRTAFTRRAAEALSEGRESGIPAAVAIIDLDRFKAINDTLGHGNGDALLCELAARFTTELGADEFAARLGGDEFGVVLRDGSQAEPVLRRLRHALGAEVTVAGLTLAVQASIGYVLAPGDGEDVETLLQRADVSMYAAKTRHTGVARYASDDDHYDAESLGLGAELRHAIDDDQLVLHYQPQMHLASQRVVALEALVRWDHPVHGLLFPDRFLPIAEQTDEIDRLTRWVLRRALRDIDALSSDLRVAVNVSARSLGRGELADEVLAVLRETSTDPDRLIVEVTETAILADPARGIAELDRLARAGVRISLDDFGQGYTSIGQLSSLPLHELKIDRSFVGDMDADPAHAAIVRSLVELGRNLGLQVVAEGVESEDISALLGDARADLIQGYLLSRPLALDKIASWLADLGEDRTPPVTA